MGRLARCNVLIVEDEVLVALDLETIIEGVGCHSVRTASNVDDALAEILRAPPDIAIVDLNVSGRLSFSVLDALATAGIPLLILSGHGPDFLPGGHRRRPFMMKPYDASTLVRRLEQILDVEVPR